MSHHGFTEVGAAPDEHTIRVGLLGYAFMAKAHSNAYRTIPYIFWPPAAKPRLVAIAGRTEERVAEAARRFGYEGYYTSWEELVEDSLSTSLTTARPTTCTPSRPSRP